MNAAVEDQLFGVVEEVAAAIQRLDANITALLKRIERIEEILVASGIARRAAA